MPAQQNIKFLKTVLAILHTHCRHRACIVFTYLFK